jgi:hypothetical protein
MPVVERLSGLCIEYSQPPVSRTFLKSVWQAVFHRSVLTALLFVPISLVRAVDVPATILAKPGKLLVEQLFEKPLPPFDGKSNGFASGFSGWRHNAVERGGWWKVEAGTFHGMENPAVQHPATASYGFPFKDVIISVEARMNDVPLDGRHTRGAYVRTTDTKDYVCSVILSEAGFRIQKDDNDHGGPDKPVPLGEDKTPLKLGAWHTVVFEILGEEMAGTVDGRSLRGKHPLIASEKCSVMFVSGVDTSFRNFRVWEALPNPEPAASRAKP